MNSSDYLDSSQEYESLYPQTVMDTDSQDSPGHHDKRPHHFFSPSHAKHFECFCGKIFISKADYNRHMLVHTGERPHECDLCGKAFSLKGNLTKHMLLHTEEKSYHCPECGKSFLKKGYIDQHMRVHTGEKPFVCTHCDRAFSLKGNLAQHMKLHTDEKSYHCLECNKLFLKKSYLVQHMRVHAGDKPHKCNLCSRAFNLKGNLVQHMKRHTGRKPFECIECGKSFALKGALKEHEKVHGGDKPFICPICSKAFNKKAYLTQHERTHTGERPFICMECGKAFSQRSILNQHMKQHGERSYKCCQCHKIFLKKLSAINKSIKNNRFGGFKCNSCEALAKNEAGSDDNLSEVFMKEEQPMVGYDSQSYLNDDSVSLYNLDSAQQHDEPDKLRITKLSRLEDFTTSSNKPISAASAHESNGLIERLYEFDTQSIQPSLVPNPSDVRKFMDYSQKKVALAHALSKENSKRSLDKTGCASLSADRVEVEELSDQSKKVGVTYAELKVVDKHKLPVSNQRQAAVGGGPSSGITEKAGLPYSQMETASSQKQSGSGERKSGSLGQPCADKPKYSGTKTAGESGVESVKSAEKIHRNNIKSTVDQSSKSAGEVSKSISASEKALEFAYRKHPALMGIDSQSSIDFAQRSIAHHTTSSGAEESDTRRSLIYSQASLSDYNARNMDLRYIENLRDPFQRNFSSLRHGNGPEVESALSRFGIKGYYNSPWSFAGNYPE